MKNLFGNFFFSYLLLALNVGAAVFLLTRPWLQP